MAARHRPSPRRRRPARGRSARRRQPPRRPFRDNPRLILAGIVAAGRRPGRRSLALANRIAGFAPDFLTEFVLYALSAADLTMLVGAGLRAGAQHHQAGRRAAARAAVRAVPRQAGRACCSA